MPLTSDSIWNHHHIKSITFLIDKENEFTQKKKNTLVFHECKHKELRQEQTIMEANIKSLSNQNRMLRFYSLDKFQSIHLLGILSHYGTTFQQHLPIKNVRRIHSIFENSGLYAM